MTQMVTKLAEDGGTTVVGSRHGSIVTSKAKIVKPTAFETAFFALYEGQKAGHMGAELYSKGGMKRWDNFLKDNPDYYIPHEEEAIIHRCASLSAQAILASGVRTVTLVSRGPGTKFDAKEGALIRAFKVAGIEVAQVVYIDKSKTAREQSIAEGKALLPNANHITVDDDIFDPELSYNIVGTEVGTCFGLTEMNIHGRHDMAAPLSAIEKNKQAFRSQQRKNSNGGRAAHFLSVVDHNDNKTGSNKGTVNKAYVGQQELVLAMLEKNLPGFDTSGVRLLPDFNDGSRVCGHGINFQTPVFWTSLSGRDIDICSNTTLYYNNSAKPSVENTKACNSRSGYEYVDLIDEDNPVLAANNRMGYHHLRAA